LNIKRVFISVYDKTNIEILCSFLISQGAEIIATEGTADYLSGKGLEVLRSEEYTKFPSILDGTIRTLHPKIIGGIVGSIDNPVHKKEMSEQSISNVDMVIINTIPFEKIVEKTVEEENLLSKIDVSDASLLLAGVRNLRNVVNVCDPRDYDEIIRSINFCGDVPLHERRKFALKALYYVINYISSVHKHLSEIFASEKYEYLLLENISGIFTDLSFSTRADLLKIENIEGLLDNVQNGNLIIPLVKANIENTYVFMKLYYLLPDLCCYIENGKIIDASIRKNFDLDYDFGDTMFASTFTITGKFIQKLYERGIKNFCGTFDLDAVKFAKEKGICFITIPERENLNISKWQYDNFGDYIIRQPGKDFHNKHQNLLVDELFAIALAEISKSYSIATVSDGRLKKIYHNLTKSELNEIIDNSESLESCVIAVKCEDNRIKEKIESLNPLSVHLI